MRRRTNVLLAITFTAAAAATLRDTPPAPAALSSLRESLDGAVSSPAWPNDEWSVLAVSIDRGDTLYSKTPEQALAPASTLKLLTTAAALRYLGAEYRYSTYLLTDGKIENGVLTGNVYLYGTGDPTLGKRFAPTAAPVFGAFADTLAAMGVREIRGDIVGDGSYFDGPSTGPGWEKDYLNAWYAPASGALSAHENLVRMDVSPGPQAGGPPAIDYIPGGDGIAIDMQAVTGGGGGVQVMRTDYTSPILVAGHVSGRVSRAVPVSDPAQYTAAILRDVMVEKGIVHTGTVRSITKESESPVTGRRAFAPAFDGAPTPRVLAVHLSDPLREILFTINHVSHNFYAEQVARTVGRVATGHGDLQSSSLTVRKLLAAAGADTSQLRIVDGCGLSPLNRVNAAAFVSLLSYMAKSPMAKEFENTLMVAGRAPRFRRMGGTAAEGNLRAKTGTIDHVSALAGYVTAADGERIAFSIISNNVPSVGQAKFIENQIGAQLASFSRGSGSTGGEITPVAQAMTPR